MALNDTQKAQIRLYLGYSDFYRWAHPALEGAFAALSAQGEALLVTEMAAVAQVDTEIAAAIATEGIKRADEIEFYPSKETRTQADAKRNEGRMHIARISMILGVRVYGDYYGSSGYPGDAYSDRITPFRGGGTMGGSFGIG